MQCTELNVEVLELRSKNENQNTEIQKLRNEIQNLNAILQNQSSESAQLQLKLSDLSQSLDESRISSLTNHAINDTFDFSDTKSEEEIKNLKSQILSLTTENQNFIQRIASYSDIEHRFEIASSLNTKLQDKIASLSKQIDEQQNASTQIVNKSIQVEESEKENQNTTANIENNNNSSNDNAIIRYQEKIAQLEQDLSMVSKAYNLLNQKLTACNNTTLKKIITSPSPLLSQRLQNNIS